MLRPRVIPSLLLSDEGLYTTRKFRSPEYVGDPINAVRIFNEKEVDELLLLDIQASRIDSAPNFRMIERIVGECFMPVCYGGGVRGLEEINTLFRLGIEKVSINTSAFENAGLIHQAAHEFGSQSIVASIDVQKDMFQRYRVRCRGGMQRIGILPRTRAQDVEQLGAGEILLTSIQQDGTQSGYDISLIKEVTSAVNIPVIASGGAGSLEHFAKAIRDGQASAVAAGTFFVRHGPHRAVLINYPSPSDLDRLAEVDQVLGSSESLVPPIASVA